MIARPKLAAVLVATAAVAAGTLNALPGAAQPSAAQTAVAQTAAAQTAAAQAPASQVSTTQTTSAAAEPPSFAATQLASYDAFDANQAVAVDQKAFYAVNNKTVTKHDRATGEPMLQFAGAEGGPFEHLDSGVVVGTKLYATHSNYPEWPMESSVEVFDTKTMRHIDTHSFGIDRGSLTWLDRHDGAWWAGFANYDKVMAGETEPYGETYNTQVVKLDDEFQVTASWTIPKPILDRFKPMSNSGGSWGPDGRLWLTGHDLGEAYVMELPAAAAELKWIATVDLPGVQGQGVAWDRSGSPAKATLWAISRANSQVKSFSVPVGSIKDPGTKDWEVLGPGRFQQ